jgi:hypothetical protein
MTDVTVAPAGGDAPAAAPANQVEINPNPVDRPAPVGSQAPEKPVGDVAGSPHRPESRREAIQRAFERASNPQPPAKRAEPKPAPKAAEAKPGHNNPPEETDKDKPIDLRKRPVAQAQEREPQPRDRGRFAPREVDGAAQQQNPPAPAAQQRQAPAPGVNFRDPPQRMSEAAKRDWGNTPESVRGDFHRMHQEFAQGYQRYKADVEAFQPVREFHEMARQQGTTLQAALSNYVSMEQKLRADLVAGLDQIVNNLGLKTKDGQRIGLRDVAYHVLSQTPDQLRATQMGNNQQAAVHQIGALHQKMTGIENKLQEMQDRQQFTYTRSAIDQFADSHPRFDELGKVIEQELKLGFDLPTAYRRAELLYPTTQAAQTRNTSAQTRQPDKSISGAPDVTASNAASRRPREGSPTPRDAAANAMRRLGM